MLDSYTLEIIAPQIKLISRVPVTAVAGFYFIFNSGFCRKPQPLVDALKKFCFSCQTKVTLVAETGTGGVQS